MTADRRLDPVRRELETREAAAFVHAGTGVDPSLRYVPGTPFEPRTSTRAVAITPTDVFVCGPGGNVDGHPADRLATRLADGGFGGTVLTPPAIPHDAALYLERAGFSLASTDAIARARAIKTPGERERIEYAQEAAAAGVERAAAVLDRAAVADGRLDAGGTAVTPTRLRREVDEAIVTAGAFPVGNTAILADADRDEPLVPGEPIVVEPASVEPGGYHGGLARTLVVDGDGGWERRAHVAVESALRSAATMLEAGDATVAAVETELAAETRSFGFGEGVSASVYGVGLARRERPDEPDDGIDAGAVVRLEAAVRDDGRTVRLADLLERRDGDARWLSRLSRSLDPATIAGA